MVKAFGSCVIVVPFNTSWLVVSTVLAAVEKYQVI